MGRGTNPGSDEIRMTAAILLPYTPLRRGQELLHVIPDFRHEVVEKYALLDCCATSSCNFLPTFRDNPISNILRVQESKIKRILEP
jgi:hypothetical protein